MKSGVELKQSLGLSQMKNIKICRIITGGSIPVYSIVFDSRRPYMPLTTHQLRSHPRIMQFVRYPYDKQLYLTPYTNLEDWNGDLYSPLFVLVDTAGYLHKDTAFDFFLEGKSTPKLECRYSGKYSHLKEFLSIPEIMASDTGSDITKKYTDERKGIMKGANINTKLIQVDIDNDLNPTFSFLADATDKYGDNHKYKEIDPETFKFKDDPSKTYTLQLKILDFVKWIDTFPKGYQFKPKDLKDILEVANVQVWNSSPSFTFQGYCYKMTQMDASIYPNNIPDKHWGPRHKDSNFVDKHLRQLFDQMGFFLNPMASMLNKAYKGAI